MIKFLRSLFSKPKREYDFIILSIESPYHGTKTIDKDALIKTLNNGGLPGVKV
jgi:BarA-like signal transduction histidine kinase